MIQTTTQAEGFEGYLYNEGVTGDKCVILNLIYPGKSIFVKKLAAWLNHQNVAALGLTVLGSPGTQKDESLVPLEYIGNAAKWLKEKGYTKVGVIGISFGAEMALAAACEYDDLSLVISLSGFDQVWEGALGTGTAPSGESSFSLNGKGLPYQPFRLTAKGYKKSMKDAKKKYGEPYGRQLWDGSRAAGIVEEANIPVEKIQGKVILLCAEKDTCWDSAGAAQRMKDRREKAGLETDVTVYPNGTHMLLPDCVPFIGILGRMMFKEAKAHPAEVKETRRKVAAKITEGIKNW